MKIFEHTINSIKINGIDCSGMFYKIRCSNFEIGSNHWELHTFKHTTIPYELIKKGEEAEKIEVEIFTNHNATLRGDFIIEGIEINLSVPDLLEIKLVS